MTNNKIRVGITQGDTNGIGYEVILKAFAESGLVELCTPIIYGSQKAAVYYRKALELTTNFSVVSSASEAIESELNLVDVAPDKELNITPGEATEESGKAAYLSLERAIKEYKEGLIDVIVTAPINKANIQSPDFQFSGHTEYLANRFGESSEPLMILINELMRVALVTTHMPIKDVASSITQEKIESKIEILSTSLHKDFGISMPRIAVLALNPHAGDGGLLGTEEEEIIKPAIETCTEKGIKCFGPYSADGFFGAEDFTHFDAVLAMYHDQALAPFKALAMDSGVNFTAGLPIIRTSPDHGTAYDIAGKGHASENSFRQAIYAATDIFRSRCNEEEAHANPLRKMYRERRDDSDRIKIGL